MSKDARRGLRPSLIAVAVIAAAVAAPSASAAPSKGKLVVTVTAPSGVPANATVNAGGRHVLTKAPAGRSQRFTLKVPAGSARLSAAPATFDGAIYQPNVRKRAVRVRSRGTTRVRVTFKRVAGAQRLTASAVTRDSITLRWKAPRRAVVQLRRTEGERPARTVRKGKAVRVVGTSATDSGLAPATKYSYSLFTRKGGKWVGPLTVQAGTASADPTVAAYVAPPSTTLVEPAEKDVVTLTPTGVTVVLGAGRPTPLVGAGFVLPVSSELPGGFLGKVESVSGDGRTVQLVATGLADAFDYYDIDVNLDELPAIPLETSPALPRRGAPGKAHAKTSRGLKSCVGGEIDGSIALRPTVQPGGRFSASIVTELGFIPVGAKFDLEAKLQLGLAADVAVKAALSCGLDFKTIIKPITTTPVPIAMVLEPVAEVSVGGEMSLQNVGYQGTVGFWTRGEIGINNNATGGLIHEAGPLPGTSSAKFNTSLGMKLGGELTVGPGGGTDVAGAVAGVGGRFIPLDATFEPWSSERGACTKTEVGWESELNLNAKAWIGSLKVGGALTLDALKWSGKYGGPWYFPLNCEAAPGAPSANPAIGPGVKEVSSTKTGNARQLADVDGLAPGSKARVLSTGAAGEDRDRNPDQVLTTEFGTPGIPALSALVGGAQTYDGATYKLVVKPEGETLKIGYVFASEEYPEYVGTGHDDVMAIWVDGVNCAKVPGTNERVSVDSINDRTNSQYYVNIKGASGYSTSFDATTVPLTCSLPVTPGKDVTIEVAIADVRDRKLDSAVALLHRGIRSECPCPGGGT